MQVFRTRRLASFSSEVEENKSTSTSQAPPQFGTTLSPEMLEDVLANVHIVEDEFQLDVRSTSLSTAPLTPAGFCQAAYEVLWPAIMDGRRGIEDSEQQWASYFVEVHALTLASLIMHDEKIAREMLAAKLVDEAPSSASHDDQAVKCLDFEELQAVDALEDSQNYGLMSTPSLSLVNCTSLRTMRRCTTNARCGGGSIFGSLNPSPSGSPRRHYPQQATGESSPLSGSFLAGGSSPQYQQSTSHDGGSRHLSSSQLSALLLGRAGGEKEDRNTTDDTTNLSPEKQQPQLPWLTLVSQDEAVARHQQETDALDDLDRQCNEFAEDLALIHGPQMNLVEKERQHRGFIVAQELVALVALQVEHRPRGKKYRPPRVVLTMPEPPQHPSDRARVLQWVRGLEKPARNDQLVQHATEEHGVQLQSPTTTTKKELPPLPTRSVSQTMLSGSPSSPERLRAKVASASARYTIIGPTSGDSGGANFNRTTSSSSWASSPLPITQMGWTSPELSDGSPTHAGDTRSKSRRVLQLIEKAEVARRLQLQHEQIRVFQFIARNGWSWTTSS